MGAVKDKIAKAFQWAGANRPKVNGFPYLAEALRQAGVKRYVYQLPSAQCIFFTDAGGVVSQGEVLLTGMSEVPRFDQDAFLQVLRKSQRGESTFPEFLQGCWETGVIHYEADLVGRKVTYVGSEGEAYEEEYPAVTVKGL